MAEVVIDDRERGDDLIGALTREVGRRPSVVRLALGDIQVGGEFILERKKAADFVASLLDRRLESQLDRLARVRPQRPLVIVEGPFNQWVLGGIDPREVRQAMLAIQLDWQIPLIRTRDVDHTAQWVADLAARADRPTGSSLAFRPGSRPAVAGSPLPRRPKKERDPRSMQVAALKRIPGVGATRAVALIERFGSVSALRQARVDQLAELPGISLELAAAIKQALEP